MTEQEVIKLLGDLHRLGLANEPKNHDDLVYAWLAFFGNDEARVINKACYIYTKIRKNHFWPAPGDIEALKKRAQWLVEMDDEEQKKLNALGGARTHTNLINKQSNHKTQPPRAPARRIKQRDICSFSGGPCFLLDEGMCEPIMDKCAFEGL